VRSARYLQGLRRYHNRHVRSWELHTGDLFSGESKAPLVTSSPQSGRSLTE
jgi:hypothetical protein